MPALIDPSNQLSLRSPDGWSGLGSVYRELANPNEPQLASKLNFQSNPAGNPGGGAGGGVSSSAKAAGAARTSTLASANALALTARARSVNGLSGCMAKLLVIMSRSLVAERSQRHENGRRP